jgi:PPOX class probable F420-dependent enzyme
VNELPESHRHLLTSPPRIGVLATNGADGFPQVSGVGFLFDDDGMIRVSALATRKKVENLRHDPQCALFVFDAETHFRYLEVRARAAVEPDEGYES